ncbi:MAG: glycosyltransferase [Chloroflexi bacterium]|nr:glycosyltransferase [Chloroflexota bacterium]
MKISLIITVKNEADALPRLLDSIAAQTLAPDDIVVVDGGSTDATLAVLRAAMTRLPVRVIVEPGANISRGRNLAIHAATGDIIGSTDAGVRLDAGWVEELVKPFDHRPPTADVVAGFFVPDPRGAFETALAATTLPALADIRPEKFLPSSRSIAFRKSAWEQVRGYPEWLDFCEDLIFDFDLQRAGFRFAFAPRAVAHFRPRPSLRAFFKQYYQYARGDGKANLWFTRHVIRYLTYLVALPLALVVTFVIPLVALALWLGAFCGMFFTPYKRLARMLGDLTFAERVSACAWVPLIRVTGDIAKMIGYPVGVVWRIRHRSIFK